MKFYLNLACLLLQFSAAVTGGLKIEVKAQEAGLTKCCPFEKSLFRSGDGKKPACLKSNLTFQPMYYTEDGLKPFTEVKFLIGQLCSQNYRLEADQFELFPNGSLRELDDFGELVQYHSPSQYCLEAFTRDNSTVVLPMICIDEEEPPADQQIASISYPCGFLISAILLILTFAIYLMTENSIMHGKILCSFIACLIMVHLSLGAVQIITIRIPLPGNFCKTVAFLIQFFFFACYSWLNILCFHTWRKMRFEALKERSINCDCLRFFMYCAYGWGLPLAVLIATITLDLDPTVPPTYLRHDFGLERCWLPRDEALLSYFYSLIFIMLFVNFGFFSFAIEYFPKSSFSFSESAKFYDAVVHVMAHRKKERYFQNLVLYGVVLASWVMEVVSRIYSMESWMWKIVGTFNSLQGLMVFVLYVALDSKTRSLVMKRSFRCQRQQMTQNNLAEDENVPLNISELKMENTGAIPGRVRQAGLLRQRSMVQVVRILSRDDH